ncbi:MAG: hypothetical protein ACI836_001251 [Saprospiraceae bacterium]|jgi:uncharacterized protein HemX|uniref:YtxH domain-containing protein n=1 Tax=Patiriisocius sp. Uisw_047 TaxID=3230969 RepID=UPI0039E7A3D3
MKSNSKKAGLAALLGIGAGVFAWWKYKNLSPEEKANVKAKIDNTGAKIKETYNDVEDTLSEKYTQLKDKIKTEVAQVNS